MFLYCVHAFFLSRLAFFEPNEWARRGRDNGTAAPEWQSGHVRTAAQVGGQLMAAAEFALNQQAGQVSGEQPTGVSLAAKPNQEWVPECDLGRSQVERERGRERERERDGEGERERERENKKKNRGEGPGSEPVERRFFSPGPGTLWISGEDNTITFPPVRSAHARFLVWTTSSSAKSRKQALQADPVPLQLGKKSETLKDSKRQIDKLNRAQVNYGGRESVVGSPASLSFV